MKARAVDLRSGGRERGRDGSATAGHDPVDRREAGPHLVNDVPDGPGAREQTLQLVAEGNGEAGREDAGVAPVQILHGRAHVGLEAGARGRRERTRRDGVGDEGDVEL